MKSAIGSMFTNLIRRLCRAQLAYEYQQGVEAGRKVALLESRRRTPPPLPEHRGVKVPESFVNSCCPRCKPAVRR
jgi:hypothetical protein